LAYSIKLPGGIQFGGEFSDYW